jgi:hypothetical protein
MSVAHGKETDMPDSADILWFKKQFQARIEAAQAGTPLTVDMITAIACQETGAIWSLLRRKNLGSTKILALCVGDSLDADKGRRAFPQTRADLLAVPGGAAMFEIAHQALVDMAEHIPGFSAAAARPHKFCHGFGLFQRDLQFFLSDPDYFLDKRYERFEDTLALCVDELKKGLRKLGLQDRSALSDHELAAVGIAYNTGGFKPAKGLKQGHFNGTLFYGEALFDFIRQAHTVALSGEVALLSAPPAGQAIVPPPSPVTAEGPILRVKTQQSMLRVRSEPLISTPETANVITHLPDGHPVRALTGKAIKGFMEIETSLAGALVRGFVSKKMLAADAAAPALIEVLQPATELPTTGIIAVTMPRRHGSVTRRSDRANAHSLNEPKQPKRVGTNAATLRAELNAIIDWLAVDEPTHARYQPRDGLTFCNIYAHDYCHLAGVYLPRVWWSSNALVTLAQGGAVAPLIGNTIHELRANDLFRWLRDQGPRFGWRQTGSLSKLQQAANQGAIGLIIARRKEDGRSGHIVPVVPELGELRAKRDTSGEVSAPLQSQAGTSNFRFGTGRTAWWLGQEFAESAFWIHA